MTLNDIPGITTVFSDAGRTVTISAQDGFELVARLASEGRWYFDPANQLPEDAGLWVFDLRRQIHEALNNAQG